MNYISINNHAYGSAHVRLVRHDDVGETTCTGNRNDRKTRTIETAKSEG